MVDDDLQRAAEMLADMAEERRQNRMGALRCLAEAVEQTDREASISTHALAHFLALVVDDP